MSSMNEDLSVKRFYFWCTKDKALKYLIDGFIEEDVVEYENEWDKKKALDPNMVCFSPAGFCAPLILDVSVYLYSTNEDFLIAASHIDVVVVKSRHCEAYSVIRPSVEARKILEGIKNKGKLYGKDAPTERMLSYVWCTEEEAFNYIVCGKIEDPKYEGFNVEKASNRELVYFQVEFASVPLKINPEVILHSTSVKFLRSLKRNVSRFYTEDGKALYRVTLRGTAADIMEGVIRARDETCNFFGRKDIDEEIDRAMREYREKLLHLNFQRIGTNFHINFKEKMTPDQRELAEEVRDRIISINSSITVHLNEGKEFCRNVMPYMVGSSG